jgi:hypothetical protein
MAGQGRMTRMIDALVGRRGGSAEARKVVFFLRGVPL